MRPYLAAMEVGFAVAQGTLSDWIPLAVLGCSLVTAGACALWEIRRRRKDAEWRAFCRCLDETCHALREADCFDESERIYDFVSWN